jgi:hypothetical protein
LGVPCFIPVWGKIVLRNRKRYDNSKFVMMIFSENSRIVNNRKHAK